MVAAVGVVSNANKYPQLGYSMRIAGTRSKVQLNPMMLYSGDNQDSIDSNGNNSGLAEKID
ncbi:MULTISPECIES: hypothetical protein [unclassified Sphingobacterium]|uniref:hypothetical protein n=1 Tax=unclassified Sphingobacterium TaxID=2609468 RepID=UPI0010504ED2|nr:MULTISPECIES: hypothetical protein [unclassified Sphingobacterium]MCS3557631.1 hypothetical protein [Sphingobacterium sp. JUb21]